MRHFMTSILAATVLLGLSGATRSANAALVPATAEVAVVATVVLDNFVDTLPLPRPADIPDLLRKLGKMVGRALGLEFALKLGACAVASETPHEFRHCVRRLLQLELKPLRP